MWMNFIQGTEDWSKMYLKFWLHRVLPLNPTDVIKVKINLQDSFVKESQLFRRGFISSLKMSSG